MKKYILSLVIFAACLLYPGFIRAEHSLVQLRIANVLMREMGPVGANNGEGAKPMIRVAEVMRNQYKEQHGKDSRITYSDILFHTWKQGGDSNYSGSRDAFAGKTVEQLERNGQNYINQGRATEWNKALEIAGQMVNGTLTSQLVKGANAFDASCGKDAYGNVKIGDAPGCLTPNSLMKQGKIAKPKNGSDYKVLAMTRIDYSKKGSGNLKNAYFWNWELGNFKHFYDDDKPATDTSNFYAFADPSAGKDADLKQDAEACTFDAISNIYLKKGDDGNTAADNYCWYCKIVIVLVNAYLKVAAEAMEKATIPLGEIILKFGFLLWLAYYILQQVSSLNPITPGKMLQEILVMMFKVALAYAAVKQGIPIIRDYYLNPIVGTGVDYGMAIFNAMSSFKQG